jgi:hypothetical protein
MSLVLSLLTSMALEMTQHLTEMSTRTLPGGKGWPVRKADNLIAICEPNVYNSRIKSFFVPFVPSTLLPYNSRYTVYNLHIRKLNRLNPK